MKRMRAGVVLAALLAVPPAADAAPETVPHAATATLKGQVVYDGDPLAPQKLKFGAAVEPHCLKGDTEDLTWVVDPKTRAVAGVVVWVKPAEGKSFHYASIPEKLRKRDDTVSMDQPYCNFVPRVAAFNPSIFDGKQQVPTGQKFVMKNSAPIQHNSHYKGSEAIPENSGNPTPRPKGELELKVKPARDGRPGEDLIHLNCGIHPWMVAKLWALDTPYYAVTGKDGQFEIRHVPAAVELSVVAWHEGCGHQGFLLPADRPTRKGQPMTFKPGETRVLNLKVRK